MKVRELIEELKNYDPNSNVLLPGIVPTELNSVSALFWDGLNGDSGCCPLLSDGSKNELTELGVFIRKLRNKYDTFLKSMADYMCVPSWFLCQIEFGTTPLRKLDSENILNFFSVECSADAEDMQALRVLLNKHAKDF